MPIEERKHWKKQDKKRLSSLRKILQQSNSYRLIKIADEKTQLKLQTSVVNQKEHRK